MPLATKYPCILVSVYPYCCSCFPFFRLHFPLPCKFRLMLRQYSHEIDKADADSLNVFEDKKRQVVLGNYSKSLSDIRKLLSLLLMWLLMKLRCREGFFRSLCGCFESAIAFSVFVLFVVVAMSGLRTFVDWNGAPTTILERVMPGGWTRAKEIRL